MKINGILTKSNEHCFCRFYFDSKKLDLIPVTLSWDSASNVPENPTSPANVEYFDAVPEWQFIEISKKAFYLVFVSNIAKRF